MILRLENVRHHAKLELELPDSGVLMIQGQSGAGKTTILDAIEEALYGTGSNIPSYGTRKCSVELIMNIPKLHIMRTRGPASLTVTDDSGAYKDDLAQEIINKALRMTEEEFLASSYIKQDSENSLLRYGPADQLRFIEALSSGKGEVDKVKKVISLKIKGLEEKLVTLNAEKTSKLSTSFSLNERIITQSLANIKPSPKYNENEINTARDIIKGLLENKANKESENKAITLALSNPGYKQLSEITTQKSIIESKIQENKAYLVSDPPVELIDNSLNLKENLDKINAQIEYIKTKSKIFAIAQSVYAQYPDAKGKNLTDFLSSTREDKEYNLTLKFADKNGSETKLNELNSLRKPQYCPSCNAPLAIISGQILATADVPTNLDELKANTASLIKSLADEISVLKNENSNISRWLSEASTLKSMLPATEPYPGIKTQDESDKIKLDLNTQLDANNKAKLLYSMEIKKRQDAGNSVTQWELHLSSIAKQSEYLSKLPPQDILFEQKKSLETEISSIDSEIDKFAELITSDKEFRQSMEKWEAVNNNIIQLTNDLAKIDNEINEISEKSDVVSSEIGATKRVKELSDFASVQAIENTIDSINASAEEFINKMFPEDGTTIRIKNVSKTKGGDDRAKLSLEIFHKGKEVNKLTDFSGGEKSRSALAFQLGLSDLYESPILMVDEGFKGLSEEGKVLCLEVLRDVSKNKLVIAVEHGAPESFFDEVVRL